MAWFTVPLSFDEQDPRMAVGLGWLERLALGLLFAIAGMTLCAWMLPALGNLLPSVWPQMKVNTALLALLSGLSLITEPLRPCTSSRIGRVCSASVLAVAGITLAEYALGRSLGIDTILAADPHALFPGRMSIQTAFSFLLLGILLLNVSAKTRLISRMVDAGTLLILLLMLVYTAGYLFGATGLFGITMAHRLSPQTLLCLILLTLLLLKRRTACGLFSLLIDDGIGGKTARLAAPFSLLLPFALEEVRGLFTRFHLIPELYGVAVASAIAALVGFCFVMVIASRCRQLECVTRELSLRDQLTHLYNRRGFLLFAEQSLRLARRSGLEFFLLFIDVDNLKEVNDHLGHEAGSEHLQKMSHLLEAAFRESDVIGRIGGDEFLVAGHGSKGHATDFVARLQLASEGIRQTDGRQFPLTFSLGQVTVAGDNTETLDALIRRADLLMYEVKRKKKVQRGASTENDGAIAHTFTHGQWGMPT